MHLEDSVIIPRSGLGTKKLYTFVSHFLNFRMSPSHTVGLERERGHDGKNCLHTVTIPHGGLGTNPEVIDFLEFLKSPSHAVGFKTYKLVKGLVETLLRESPSHPVGSEHTGLKQSRLT